MLVLLCVSALLVEACSSSMIDHLTTFSFPSFSPESCSNGELLCMGSAASGEGSVRLTSEPWINSSSASNSSATNRIGRVLYREKVRAWPALISTSFTMRITPMDNSSTSGDGLAFVFAKDRNPSPPASYGSYMGLFDDSTQGELLQQMAVAFDTFKNEFDQDGNHIGIITESIISPVDTVSLNSYGFTLKSGRHIQVKIEYDGSISMLHVSLGYPESQLKSVLSLAIDLPNIVPSTVYVGFTASTGKSLPESHEVLNWVFTSAPLPLSSNKTSKNETTKTILIIVIPIFLVTLASSVLFIWHTLKKGKKTERSDKQDEIECLSMTAPDIPKGFSFRQLYVATSSFCKENLLGRGGFGCVYKGLLLDPPKTIAVKKISANSKQGEREYFAEICTIGRLRHKNIVQLLGWCHEGEYLLLVYEYMQNGSLDHFIGKDILNWQTRHKILVGIASALLYLHEECGNPVVHRDVKPNNIMLDSDFNAHLGDFGLARLLQDEESVITNLAGTPGYLAPEVGFTGKATPESDVYSFGMVVLEVVCGRRSKSTTAENSLVDYVWNMHSENALMECVDALLRDQFDEEEARRALMVGLACLYPDSVFRPKMRKVVHILLDPNEPLMELPGVRPCGVYVSSVSSSTSTSNFGSRSSSYPFPLLQLATTSSDEITIVYDQQ
ncbi:L-type lectin-domain containing receptor kinase IX.1-like [Prosopis cineraria]|uniref:L-type lectin-domain containing receptor kinase IX.1-like n=1 Tax=Prosopis cineraria TaxID=364024 RepID=UPI00240F4A3C|nr:L-type lectin-domain containing receptor kinase IX.1-like [Prosopis cineraria]